LTTGFDWAVPPSATLIVGDAGDQSRLGALIAAHRIDAIIHFAASIVVPDSVRDPLGYYRNNTVNSGALIEAAPSAVESLNTIPPAANTSQQSPRSSNGAFHVFEAHFAQQLTQAIASFGAPSAVGSLNTIPPTLPIHQSSRCWPYRSTHEGPGTLLPTGRLLF